VLEDLLGADAGYRGPRIGCAAGHQAQFVSYRDKTVDTVLGPVTVSRAWYHCAACRHGLAPRDGELGTAGQTMSPGLAKMSARAAAAVPFTSGAGLVGELAGITLTGKRLGRHAEADGRAAAAVIKAEAAAIAARTLVPLPPPAPVPDKLYVAIDGTGVPMMTAETDGRPGKGEDGKARTREVKLACAFTQTRVDDDGYPIRDPGSSSYLATFAPAAQSGTLMAAEARRRGAGHVRQVTILGDGAHWIWNLASQHFPEATQIVDLYHAREHLHDLAKLLAFMLGDNHDGWLAARLDELDDGDVPALLSAARQFPLTGIKADALDTALGYFETNAPGCATSTSAPAACSSAPAPSKQAARQSSGSASNSPACTGQWPAQPASSPCAASKPAADGNRSGSTRTTRQARPDPASENAGTLRPSRPSHVTGQSPTFLSRTRRLRSCPDLSEGRVTVILCARPRGGM
jgi:hypothetical protein